MRPCFAIRHLANSAARIGCAARACSVSFAHRVLRESDLRQNPKNLAHPAKSNALVFSACALLPLLFCKCSILNSLVFNRVHALLQKHPWGRSRFTKDSLFVFSGLRDLGPRTEYLLKERTHFASQSFG